MNTKSKPTYLPRCVRKKEIRNYFGEGFDFIWSNIITEEVLKEWGIKYEDIKYLRHFPPELTEKFYVHFQITDLNQPYSDRIKGLIEAAKSEV